MIVLCLRWYLRYFETVETEQEQLLSELVATMRSAEAKRDHAAHFIAYFEGQATLV